MCSKLPDKAEEEEEEKAESPQIVSAALSCTDRRTVSTGDTAIVFVAFFSLSPFTVLPSNLIGAEFISPNTHFAFCLSKFGLAWSTAFCKRKRNVASAPHFHCSPSESCLFLF